jgi:release factor glutamine methyltransferase
VREAELDARLLLEYVCGTDRNTLLAHPEREVTKAEAEEFFRLIARREKREPLQYITGEREFMGLTFETSPDTLIPRQDTECLVEEAMKELHDGMEILDLCCGTGCILLSLLKYSNDCKGFGVDLNESAVELAKKNAKNLGIEAEFAVSDLFEAVDGKYDVITSNPPYIPTKVIETLDPEVKSFEPMTALDGGEDGLDFYRVIAAEAKNYLKRGGMIFLEIGFDQGEDVSKLLEENGYKNVAVIKDLAGLDRVVKAHNY